MGEHRGAARPTIRRTWLYTAVASAITMLLVAGAAPSSAAQAHMDHAVVDGVAEIFGSTCPFGHWVPEVATECEDWLAMLFKESAPKQHNQTPWGVFLVRARALVHPDGRVDVLEDTGGVTYEVESAFDERHLTFARARASVPMSDGSVRQVDLVWDGSGVPLQVAGNTGPYHLNRGTTHHVGSRCFTANLNFQQTYRASVALTGTVDGIDVDSIPYIAPHDPFLGRGQFVGLEVVHRGCR